MLLNTLCRSECSGQQWGAGTKAALALTTVRQVGYVHMQDSAVSMQLCKTEVAALAYLGGLCITSLSICMWALASTR